jgi:hypothetical protein
MPTLDPTEVLKVLREAVAFTRRMGCGAEAEALEAFATHFQHEKPTLKVLRGPVQDAKGIASLKIRDVLYDDETRRLRPEMSADHAEFTRIWQDFGNLIYQVQTPTEVKGLVPGNDSATSVLGNVAEARKIAASSLEVARRFSEAVIQEDIETAYGLCANELRCWMSVKRFVTELARADAEYNGKPISFTLGRVTWIYADEAARKGSNKEGEWPKDTPKQNKRALVGGWWTAQQTAQGELGRWVFFWVTEEAEGYRIAKFEQYHQ